MAASSGFAREAYFQEFWMPPDPQLPTLGPLLFTDAEVTVLSDIFASYTDDIVGASVAAGIQTSCFIDSQEGSVQEKTDATINTVGFFCVWVSAAGVSVEAIPGAFFDFLTDNVGVLTTDMTSRGLSVIESYPPMARSITAAPAPAVGPIVSDPVSAGPSFAREIFNQEFSVSSDPDSAEPAPLLFTEPQLFAFATILADYTSNYVADPSSVAEIQSVCFVDEQTGYVQEATGATILNIGYFCNWNSETVNVESLPQAFIDYVSNNLEALENDLFTEGITVFAVFAPIPRSPPTGIPTTAPPTSSATDPPVVVVTTSFVREIFNQDFWVPSDPDDPKFPIFYDQQDSAALQRILSNYTAAYVDPGIAAGQIRTVCFVDELTGFGRNDGATILTVGYFCTWSSDFVNVEGLPLAFIEYFTSMENLNVLTSDMISQGLPVTEAYPPDIRAPPTAAPAFTDPPATATLPTVVPAPTATDDTASPAASPADTSTSTRPPSLESSSGATESPLAPNVTLVPVPAPVVAPTTPPVPLRSPTDPAPTAPPDSSTSYGASRSWIRSSYTVLLTAILILYLP